MYRFFDAIAARKVRFIVAAAIVLALFVLAQISFRTAFTGIAGAPERPELPDSSLHYNAAELVSMMDVLGGEGRAAYLRLGLVDTVFPLAYGIFFAVSIALAWGRLAGYPRIASTLLIVPLIGAASDLAENVAVRFVIALFERGARAEAMIAVPPFAARVSGWLTTLKWSAFVGSVLIIMVGAVIEIVRRRSSADRGAT